MKYLAILPSLTRVMAPLGFWGSDISKYFSTSKSNVGDRPLSRPMPDFLYVSIMRWLWANFSKVSGNTSWIVHRIGYFYFTVPTNGVWDYWNSWVWYQCSLICGCDDEKPKYIEYEEYSEPVGCHSCRPVSKCFAYRVNFHWRNNKSPLLL